MAFQTPETFPSSAAYPAAASFPAVATYPSNYDPDAVLYFAATGVSDATQMLNISQFFTGLKKNSWFGDLLEGWTFRSAQSMGSGATAPGMKGFMSCTLTNSPTWGTTGITLNGTTQYLVSASNIGILGLQPRTLISINTSASGSRGFIAHGAVTGAGLSEIGYLSGISVFNSMPTTPDTVTVNTGAAPTPGNFAMYAGAGDGLNYNIIHSFDFASYQAITATTGANTTNSAIYVGVRSGGGSLFNPGTHAAAFVLNTYFSNANFQTFYALYKGTIGQGLGLT